MQKTFRTVSASNFDKLIGPGMKSSADTRNLINAIDLGIRPTIEELAKFPSELRPGALYKIIEYNRMSPKQIDIILSIDPRLLRPEVALRLLEAGNYKAFEKMLDHDYIIDNELYQLLPEYFQDYDELLKYLREMEEYYKSLSK